MSAVEVDRVGLQYGMLLAIQQNHLDLWKPKLPAELHIAVSAYVVSHNQQARENTEKHQVFRGQDLVQIILTWPNVGPVYPAVKDASEGVI